MFHLSMRYATILYGALSILIPLGIYCVDKYLLHKRWLGKLCFLIYVAFILYETILSRNPNVSYGINLTPFWSYAYFSKPDYRWQMYQNVFLFIPLGFLTPFLFKWRFPKCILVGLAFSIAIEAAQYFFQLGLCEFDDVFHNTLGSIIGFLLWSMVTWFSEKYEPRLKKWIGKCTCRIKTLLCRKKV